MTGIDVDDLIDRLRKATAGDGALDRDFAAACGIAWSPDEDGQYAGYGLLPRRCHFTRSLSAAARVVPSHLMWDVESRGMAWVGRPDARVRGFERAATPALAFCIALLVALRSPLDRPERPPSEAPQGAKEGSA
jgi:hypothetical protein